jgi:hypothetical protein
VVAFFLIWGINTFYSIWEYLYRFPATPFALTMAKVISLESSGIYIIIYIYAHRIAFLYLLFLLLQDLSLLGFLNFVVYGFFNKQLRTRYTFIWGFVTFLFSPIFLIVALVKYACLLFTFSFLVLILFLFLFWLRYFMILFAIFFCCLQSLSYCDPHSISQYLCRPVSPHEAIDPPTPSTSAYSQAFSPSNQRLANFPSGDDPTYNSTSFASGKSILNSVQSDLKLQ